MSYYNMRVDVLGKRRRLPSGHYTDEVIESIPAWGIEIARTGRIRVQIDNPDGPDWNYANPAGVRDLPLGTRVAIQVDG